MSLKTTIIIPAGGQSQLTQRGSFFYCISTTDVYSVQADYGDQHVISAAGGTFGSADSPFLTLSFYNATGADIQTTILVSNSAYRAADSAAGINQQSATVGRVRSKQFLVTIPAGGIAQFSAVDLWFTGAVIYGYKDLAGTNNGANVKIGPSGAANQQPFLIAPADVVDFKAPAGQQRSFADFYVSGNPGDGVVVIYS